ncbi:hypothetical protein BH09PSE6_BH09PSE6_04360 [soil metagenome]
MKSIPRVSFLAACLALVLAACTPTPVPEDKLSYVGEWKSDTRSLRIDREGHVSYKRDDGGVQSSVNAPIKAFVGDDFEVGMGPIKTTFVVNQVPREDSNGWSMVVDGATLRKTSN